MDKLESPPPINQNITVNNDKDLVELAGYRAYTHPAKVTKFYVNNNEYRVLNTRYEDPTGLDAMTVMNTETKEISIIYVGTDAKAKYGNEDIITDAQLLSDLTPEQITAAREYYNQMNETYKDIGGVKNVAGNSLGGGLVGAVAIENPEVKAVTLNPALLPEGMMTIENRTHSR